MAKGKRNDEATVKASESAGETPAGKKAGGRRKAEVAAEAEAEAKPAKGKKKAGGGKKAAEAEPAAEVKVEPAKGKKKAGGGKKAAEAEPVAEAAREPAKGKKKAGKKAAEPEVVAEAAPEPAKGKKKAGGKKAEVAEPAAEAKPEPVNGKKKAGGGKKAAKVEVKAEPAKGKKKAGKKAAEPEVAAEATPEPSKGKKKAGGGKKATEAAPAAEAAPEPTKAGKKKTGAAKAEKKAGKKKSGAEKAEKKPGKAKADTEASADEKPSKKKAGKAKAGAEKAEKAEKKPGKKKAAETAEPEAKPGKKKVGKGSKSKKPAGPTLAERLDKHILYQLAVQSPEADIEFFVARYKELRGREPKVLREDFCGTAYISATWAGSGKGRRAIGVDLDAATLQWAREHNLAPLSKDAQKRVDLRQANVLDGGGAKADITCAMNFSYGVFKTRAELKHYFEVVHQQLADDGVFVTELYGGTEAIIAVQDEREIEGNEETGGDFTYYWEQAAYNPITHETLCHIHFELSDRSKIEKAFTYDWRLWSIAEVRELLYEVGFTRVRVYWESIDEDGDGTGEYHPSEQEENQEAWLVYLVAAK